jgi:hypothetical protein
MLDKLVLYVAILKKIGDSNMHGDNEIKRGDTFEIGEICPESGVYRIKNHDCSEEQREIPLVKGKKFPPCKNCKGHVVWEFVRHA